MESGCRTSIGRSYYGLFNVLLDAPTAKGVNFRQTPDDHHLLTSYLTKAKHPQALKIGSKLKRLRASRNAADYDMTSKFEATRSRDAYNEASIALRYFDSLADHELAQIVSTIQLLS